MYKTVKKLRICTHKQEKSLTMNKALSTFVAKFKHLTSLDAHPNESFNPYEFINTKDSKIDDLTVFTPDTSQNCMIASDFITSLKPKKLVLKYVQQEQRTYNFKLYDQLKHLTLENLNNVDVSKLYPHIRDLLSLHIINT